MGLGLGVVVLTMGDRPRELGALLDSVAAQEGEAARVVVIGQGARLPPLPPWADAVEPPKNLGIPGGRSLGVRRLRELGGVDVVVNLDDDGLLPRTDTFRLVREAFEREQRLGVVGFRVADATGHTRRRHALRPGRSGVLRSGVLRSGEVPTFLGGGHAIRMSAIDRVGGFPARFFYAHEETDFAWRVLDAGWSIRYRADLLLQHPRTDPARPAAHNRPTARNRVRPAERRLPAALLPPYPASWSLHTLTRRPPAAGLRAWWSGFLEGVRTPSPPRLPMRWATVWRMTRLGHPPVF
ncbi:glycosyltransferase family 2 protein [Kitasatospora sp. NPDC006786]|uniref:glycosyltransferase family 2 protein n=1 Tax=unclassified Kitasatospora TaxID=2633591 RepID=UPI0033CF0CA8